MSGGVVLFIVLLSCIQCFASCLAQAVTVDISCMSPSSNGNVAQSHANMS